MSEQEQEQEQDQPNLADAVDEGLEQAGEDLQNTIKIFMELVPTTGENETAATPSTPD